MLTQNSDEIGNTKERDDDKKSFSSFPVLMICWLSLSTGPELSDHNIEDGDQDESVGCQQK